MSTWNNGVVYNTEKIFEIDLVIFKLTSNKVINKRTKSHSFIIILSISVTYYTC